MPRPSASKFKWSSFSVKSLRHKAKSPSTHDVLAEADSNLSSALHFLDIASAEILGDGPIDALTHDWKKQRALFTGIKDNPKTSREPKQMLHVSTELMAQTNELLLKAKAASESTIIGRIERRERLGTRARADVETKLSEVQLNNTRLAPPRRRPTGTSSSTNPFEPAPVYEEINENFNCA